MKYWHEQKTKRNAVTVAILSADSGNATFKQALINIAVFGTLGFVITALLLMAV